MQAMDDQGGWSLKRNINTTVMKCLPGNFSSPAVSSSSFMGTDNDAFRSLSLDDTTVTVSVNSGSSAAPSSSLMATNNAVFLSVSVGDSSDMVYLQKL